MRLLKRVFSSSQEIKSTKEKFQETSNKKSFVKMSNSEGFQVSCWILRNLIKIQWYHLKSTNWFVDPSLTNVIMSFIDKMADLQEKL